MVEAEMISSMQFPVYDYRYRADPKSPFNLYQALEPALVHDRLVPKYMSDPNNTHV